MSKNMFAAKLAAGTRKAKKITTKSAASTNKAEKITTKSTVRMRAAEKIISKAIPKSTSLTELAYQKDLLNPIDLELFWKKNYLVRIWPD
ncbi:MAG: hypothetical protein ACQ9ET_05625 [Nitrosomonadaceae bacterium]